MTSVPNTSLSRRRYAPCSARHQEHVPIIVAEALLDVADPLAAGLDAGPAGTLIDVVASLAGACAPIEADVVAPPWLRPEQVAPFRRVVASLEHFGLALLADPVGSGKTYIALAIARQLNYPAVAIVPAAIVSQWRDTAARLAVPVTIWTHERMSRGALPPAVSLVIVDESHRYRNSGIARYQHLARWAVGRQVLLLSATPVVNRLEDLAHQLLLGLRSDALAPWGVPDLLVQLRDVGSHPAFGRVVLCRPAPTERPTARHESVAIDPPPWLGSVLEQVGRLKLSTNGGVAALIRVTLLRALASSLPAFAGTLRRYRSLLQQGSSAAQHGRVVTRAEIRRFTSASLDQMVMWELLVGDAHTADLALDDLGALERLVSLTSRLEDPRFTKLLQQLDDDAPTVVFTASRDTLTALRRLGWRSHCAWISGDGAGLGASRVPPGTVLSWFRPGAEPRGMPLPRILLATDIAAEGLDLQRATRLVHFDLPWTPMRLDQREGRAVRLGSASPSVLILQWLPWTELEEELQQVERLARKRNVIGRSGITPDSHWLYRWRSLLVTTDRTAPAVAAVQGPRAGWLVGVAIDPLRPDGRITPSPADLVWLPDDGDPVEDSEVTIALLDEAISRIETSFVSDELPRDRLAAWIRQRLQAGASSRWKGEAAGAPGRQLIRRLQQLGRDAARQRDRTGVELADRAIEGLRGGLSAGEAILVQELAGLPATELRLRLGSLQFRPRERATWLPRLIGAVRFILPP